MLNFDRGVYTITSPSGKQYIGSTLSFKERWRHHLSHLRKGTHHNRGLQSAFQKYGEDAIVFAKVAFCPREDLLFREQEQIDSRDRKSIYNACLVAGSPRGRKHTAESRAKMSKFQKGRTFSPEARDRLSQAHKGRKHTADHRANNSAAHKGIKHSEQARAKMSASRKGRRQSAEAVAKTAAANRGRKHGVEVRERMSAAQRGKRLSPEHRAKLSVAGTGRVLTAEDRAKISAAKTGKPNSRNTSGYAGVHKIYGEKWRANPTIGGKRMHLGVFDTSEEAHAAILKAREALKDSENK